MRIPIGPLRCARLARPGVRGSALLAALARLAGQHDVEGARPAAAQVAARLALQRAGPALLLPGAVALDDMDVERRGGPGQALFAAGKLLDQRAHQAGRKAGPEQLL